MSVQPSLRAIAVSLLVDHHVAGGRRQLDHQPVERLAHADLAAQPRGMGEPEGEIEHVLLVLAGRRQLVEPVLFDDHMTGRAGERAFAGAFDVDVVAMGDLEHAEAKRRLYFLARPVLENERHLRHSERPHHSPTRLSSSLTDNPDKASRMPRSMRRSANGLLSSSSASAAALISSRPSPAIAPSRRARPASSAARSSAASKLPSLASAASSASRLRRASTRASVSRRAVMSASAFSRLS